MIMVMLIDEAKSIIKNKTDIEKLNENDMNPIQMIRESKLIFENTNVHNFERLYIVGFSYNSK
jgi:hypothetical protein